jgi:glycosyltransferase involved in cell wall biosynthesis
MTALWHDLIWSPVTGRRAARDVGADVYHVPFARGSLTTGSPPLVVTIHDLVVLRNPEVVRRWNRYYTTIVLPRVARVADVVITPSADTANDVEKLLRIDASRIRVVPNGVSDRFFGAPTSSEKASEPYVLFVGSSGPRKNLGRLLTAMSLLRQRGHEELLFVAGTDGQSSSGVPISADGVRVLGPVDDDRLHALYAGARCVVLPSLHEGFGLPALEAMACGVPVVAARAGGLPEVCGDAAVLVNPLDVNAIADGIAQALAEGSALGSRGRLRAREFSWDVAAAEAVAVYRSVL